MGVRPDGVRRGAVGAAECARKENGRPEKCPGFCSIRSENAARSYLPAFAVCINIKSFAMKESIHSGRESVRAVFAGLLGIVFLMTACDGGETTQGPAAGPTASLTVTLKGQEPSVRAVAPAGDPEQEELAAAENSVHNVTVFVFNANGTLDKKHTFAPSVLSETITGLLAGPKKLVVLANVPSTVSFPDGIDYDWFADVRNVIGLDTQKTAADGLFMSGEGSVTLTANASETSTVAVSRLVAKVKLGTVSIVPEAGHDAAKFALTGVMVMKARGSAQMGVPSAAYTPDLFYGGMKGGKSEARDYLAETVTTEDHANRYFYVLPSDNADGNTTLITLAGTYAGEPTYFSFRINDGTVTGGGTNDGTFIRRNSVYTVNVTLKRLGGGSTDPEVTADPASLTVTVEPQEWATELVQNVEW